MMMIIEYTQKPRRRWLWPWSAVKQINQAIREANELRQRNAAQAHRIRELDDLCQRQQAALIEIEQAKPKRKGKRR